MFRPVKDQKVYEHIVSQIQQLIEEGTLKPGDRLPSEPELATNLGVSRASVRDALNLLELLGVITRTPGRGTYVANWVSVVNLEEVLHSFTVGTFAHEALRHVMEARLAVEPVVAQLAAESITPDESEELEAILVKLEAQIAAGDSGCEEDLEIHQKLGQIAGNPIFMRMMDAILELLAQGRVIQMQAQSARFVSLERHRAIVEAVTSKDPGRARRAMVDHLLRSHLVSGLSDSFGAWIGTSA